MATAAQQTICLTMIVKDEAQILRRLVRSCRQLIDYWVICDTGSTDNTQGVIARELHDIPGELHHATWVDFGTNRSELMELAAGKADYLLLLDADMTIKQHAPIGELTADAYLVRQTEGDVEHWNRRLVRGELKWRYIGATHEHIESSTGTETVERLDTLEIEHHADGGSWSHKFERDIELLTNSLANNPDDPRSWFYLAQSCRDLAQRTNNKHMLANALDYYQHRADMDGWDEETYFACYQVGLLAAQLDDWPRALDAYTRAWEIRPQRLEALHALAIGLRERGRYHAAHQFTRIASALRPLPIPNDILFVAPWIYDWGVLFEYSVTAYWVGEHSQSLAACKRLLTIEHLPDEHRELTRKNAEYALREIAKTATDREIKRGKIKQTGPPTRGLPN